MACCCLFGCCKRNRPKPQLEQVVYITPPYLRTAAQRKYGRRIQILGAEQSALTDFWSSVEATGAYCNNEERPKEDSKLIVDITAKEHCNSGYTDSDEIEVETNNSERERAMNSYTVSFSKESGWEFGGGLKVGGSFFNTASAFLGIEGNYKKNKSESEEKKSERERELSHLYGIKATKVTVPPRTKVAVRITTYAVTYKVNVNVKVNIPITSFIPFYYRKSVSCLFCCCCCGCGGQKFGYITAQELFPPDQKNVYNLGYCIQFISQSVLSYVGETVELYKEEIKLPPKM